MVAALKRHANRPIVHLGDVTLTGRETSERISQYIQAFESLGAGRGSAGALLALNRPEVLFILGAGQTQGFRRTSLHPLGSVDDHVYVLEDAEIEALIFDPIFAERAAALKERVPSLRLLSLGPCDAADADLIEVAAGFEPGPAVAVAHHLQVALACLVRDCQSCCGGCQPRRRFHHGHVDRVRALRAAKD